jgi:hypothetical protein
MTQLPAEIFVPKATMFRLAVWMCQVNTLSPIPIWDKENANNRIHSCTPQEVGEYYAMCCIGACFIAAFVVPFVGMALLQIWKSFAVFLFVSIFAVVEAICCGVIAGTSRVVVTLLVTINRIGILFVRVVEMTFCIVIKLLVIFSFVDLVYTEIFYKGTLYGNIFGN